MKLQAALFLIAIATTEVASSGHDSCHDSPDSCPDSFVRGLKSGKKGTPKSGDMVEKSSKEPKHGSDTTKGPKEHKSSKEPKHESDTTKGPKEHKSSKESKHGSDTTKGPKEHKSSKEPKHGSDTTKGPKEHTLTKLPKKTKVPKSKGAKSSKSKSSNAPPTTASCPFDERRVLKASTSKSAKSTGVPLADVWGQDPGTQIVISLADDPTYCVQPVGLSAGQGLEAVPCTYDDADAFTIDAYGQLHTSDPALCVTGAGSDLVLGACDVCSAVFQCDPDEMTITPVFADATLFWTTAGGTLFLLEDVAYTQQFLCIPFTSTEPPTSTSTEPPTSSSPPSTM